VVAEREVGKRERSGGPFFIYGWWCNTGKGGRWAKWILRIRWLLLWQQVCGSAYVMSGPDTNTWSPATLFCFERLWNLYLGGFLEEVTHGGGGGLGLWWSVPISYWKSVSWLQMQCTTLYSWSLLCTDERCTFLDCKTK
jgi:hypothetical protein